MWEKKESENSPKKVLAGDINEKFEEVSTHIKQATQNITISLLEQRILLDF
jgi:hypothetical protein